MRELLENNWTAGLSEEEAVKLTVRTLLEVVDSGSSNMGLVIVRSDGATEVSEDEVNTLSAEIKAAEGDTSGGDTAPAEAAEEAKGDGETPMET
eukprot:scaffold645_cov247-Pinguiococcus_pyrenoidosus.AAC.4